MTEYDPSLAGRDGSDQSCTPIFYEGLEACRVCGAAVFSDKTYVHDRWHSSFHDDMGRLRSFIAGQEALADPAFRAYLEASIDRLNTSTAEPMSSEEFLAATKHTVD